MAKSLRSKSKRSFRAKKRESGKYAAADAARLERLHVKLASVRDGALPDGDVAEDCAMVEEGEGEVQGSYDPEALCVSNTVQGGEGMALDESNRSVERLTSVSTHGPRGSRREEWRKSKGMDPIPKRHGMNRQGGLAARRKAGRPSRRR